jgi:hypothetical protein
MIGIVTALVIGGLFGFAWSMIIARSGAVNLQYFNGISNSNVCTRSSTQKFKCTTTYV